MHNRAPTISTACPRCGQPTVWELREHGGGWAVVVLRAGCDCWLSPDQWADLAERANTLLPHDPGASGEMPWPTYPAR
jgi:hypothetical protein